MARNGYAKPVLVSTEWLAEHLGDDGIVVAEVDENPDLYDEGHIPGAVKLHWREDLQDPVERDLVDKETFEALLAERGIAQRHDARPLRRQEQLVRGVRLLVREDLRPHGRADPRRRPAEVDRRGPRAVDGLPPAPATYTAQERDESIRAFRDQVRVDGRRRPRARRRAQPGRVRRRPDRAARLRAGGRAARRPHPDRALDPVGTAVRDDGTFAGGGAGELYGGRA